MKLTQKVLKELIYYDPDTGIFTWLERDIKWFDHCKQPEGYHKTWNAKYANNTAGCFNNDTDYLQILVFGKKYYGHRLAWLYMTGKFPTDQIDHEDQNRRNCMFENLRDTSQLKNQQNATMKSTNKSGFNGVHFEKSSGKWRARITANNKKIHGGLFTELDDAIEKRKQMNVEYGFHRNHGRK